MQPVCCLWNGMLEKAKTCSRHSKMCVFLTDQQSSVSYGELHRSWNWASAGFTNPQNVLPTRTMHTHHHTEPFTLYTRTKITTANTPAVSNTTTCTFIKYDLFVVHLQHTIHIVTYCITTNCSGFVWCYSGKNCDGFSLCTAYFKKWFYIWNVSVPWKAIHQNWKKNIYLCVQELQTLLASWRSVGTVICMESCRDCEHEFDQKCHFCLSCQLPHFKILLWNIYKFVMLLLQFWICEIAMLVIDNNFYCTPRLVIGIIMHKKPNK